LLARERRFQRTKEHGIWIPCAKVRKGQIIFGKCSIIVSSIYVHIDFRNVPRAMMVVLDRPVGFEVYPFYTIK